MITKNIQHAEDVLRLLLLDQNNLNVNLLERLPDIGLGKSINDKLEITTKKD